MLNPKTENMPDLALRGDEKIAFPQYVCTRPDKCPYRMPGNIYQTDKCPTCDDAMIASHLTVLISRVREDETTFHYASKEHLVNLAEYIVSWPEKYAKAEYTEAIKILANYHLAHLADRKRGLKLIQAELNKSYKARCHRCGLPITSPLSLATGHGAICRRKLGIKPTKSPSFQ